MKHCFVVHRGNCCVVSEDGTKTHWVSAKHIRQIFKTQNGEYIKGVALNHLLENPLIIENMFNACVCSWDGVITYREFQERFPEGVL